MALPSYVIMNPFTCRHALALWGALLLIPSPTVIARDEVGQPAIVEQWATHEITLEAQQPYANPYTDVEVWAVFTNDHGTSLKRPAFWDGGARWKIRFAPIDAAGRWRWQTHSTNAADAGLTGKTGEIKPVPRSEQQSLAAKGLLKMSPGRRSVVHADGSPFLMVADTAWSIPFRATPEQVETYAKDRQQKGFNTVLLSTVMPDRKAEGPEARDTVGGFMRAFDDIKDGHMNHLRPDYFQALDGISQCLVKHGLVPVYAVMLHGYGWRGQSPIGGGMEGGEYVRFCKYLLARYGAAPAMWLLSVDGAGQAPGVEEGGRMLQEWDGYAQPTGLHYNPFDDTIPSWAKDLPDPKKYCLHENKIHQAEEWLDFQWAQTGHDGLHNHAKVFKMYDNIPTKAVANGEPTYEGMNEGKAGLGWWQGEEAWMQLVSGGTMGIAYGACSVWRWKITADETGWDSWTEHNISWKQALDLEGSRYAGLLGKILQPYNLTDIQRRWDLAEGKPLLARSGELYIAYLAAGGDITIDGPDHGLQYRWINPRTGESLSPKPFAGKQPLQAPSREPWVLVVSGYTISR